MAKRKTLFNSSKNIKRREFIKIAATAAAAVAVPVLAQVQTDVGTLDKEQAAKSFPSKSPYSPYAGRDFPTRPLFGDTHTHTSFSMDAGALARCSSEGSLSFCQRRRNYGFQRPAGKTVSAARLPSCCRSFRQHGLLSPTFCRRPQLAGRSDRPSLVRHDPKWERCRSGHRDHRELLSGKVS